MTYGTWNATVKAFEDEMTTLDKAENLIRNYKLGNVQHIWPSLHYCAEKIVENIDGCEWTPFENVIMIDNVHYEVAWRNRKQTKVILREAEAPEC